MMKSDIRIWRVTWCFFFFKQRKWCSQTQKIKSKTPRIPSYVFLDAKFNQGHLLRKEACVSFLSIMLSKEQIPPGVPRTCSGSFQGLPSGCKNPWGPTFSWPETNEQLGFFFVYGCAKFSILLEKNKRWSLDQLFRIENQINFFLTFWKPRKANFICLLWKAILYLPWKVIYNSH